MVDRPQGQRVPLGPRGHLAPYRHAAALLAVVAIASGCADEPAADEQTTAVVFRIGDGDSLGLTDGTRVRLLQVDAPELGQGECFAGEARRELERLAPPGERVALESDSRLDDRDRYDRALRYVLVDEVNVNVELVRRGAATPYFRGGDEGRDADELLSAVDEARRGARGMWAACRVSWQPDRAVTTRSR